MPGPYSFRSAIATALIICVVAALLEGLFAGRNVKGTFARLRFPRYSLPLRAWFVIGAAYYVVFFVLIVRILRAEEHAAMRTISLVIALKMMFINALWNVLFFRMRHLPLSFALGVGYTLICLTLFGCLLKLDRAAAWTLSPYVVYLGYANYWGYALWKLNDGESSAQIAGRWFARKDQ